MLQKIEINVAEGVQVLEVREGQALPLQEPIQLLILGTIECPANFVVNRLPMFDHFKSHVTVNYEEKSIELIVDESNFYRPQIKGRLIISDEIKKLGINSGEKGSTHDFANMFRLNRSLFESIDAATKIIQQLRAFKAKVDKQIENADDKRGNVTQLRAQIVESNLPASFIMKAPIFKGGTPESFEVDIDIDPITLECSLVSPHLAEIVHTQTRMVMNREIEKIKEAAPNLLILTV